VRAFSFQFRLCLWLPPPARENDHRPVTLASEVMPVLCTDRVCAGAAVAAINAVRREEGVGQSQRESVAHSVVREPGRQLLALAQLL
jgi:hypothetical protein